MAWCFSTRASVATVLTTHPCVSRCLRVNVELWCLHCCCSKKLLKKTPQKPSSCWHFERPQHCNRNDIASTHERPLIIVTNPHWSSKWNFSNQTFLIETCVGCFWFTLLALIHWLVHDLIVQHVNTLRPRQNGCHFADNIFKCIFLDENLWILIKISLKFVPKGSINNIQALVQIMAWHRPGDKPLSEPTMVRLTIHICITQPQWVEVAVELFKWNFRNSSSLMEFCVGCFWCTQPVSISWCVL